MNPRAPFNWLHDNWRAIIGLLAFLGLVVAMYAIAYHASGAVVTIRQPVTCGCEDTTGDEE